MENLKIATAQFEHKSSDKSYNLSIIRALTEKAASRGRTLLPSMSVQSRDTVLPAGFPGSKCYPLQNQFLMARVLRDWLNMHGNLILLYWPDYLNGAMTAIYTKRMYALIKTAGCQSQETSSFHQSLSHSG